MALGVFEIEPPDLSFFPKETGGPPFVATIDSGRVGPRLLINALAHGNELCGAHAVKHLLDRRLGLLAGSVTVCLANVDAYRSFDPFHPALARYLDEDFNRIWSDSLLDGPGDSRERRRARQLRPVFRRADAVLDLHSMQSDGPPLILCGRTKRAQTLAAALGYPRVLVADDGHEGGRRLIDYPTFADPTGTRIALLVECGQHGRAETVQSAIRTSLRFLAVHGVIDAETAWGPPWETGAEEPVRVQVTHVVTASGDDFVLADEFGALQVVERAGTVIGYDAGRAIRTPYDDCVLVMPGRRVQKGQTAVRLGRRVASFAQYADANC